MDKNLPNRWVREAVYDAIDGIVVDGYAIECFDTYVSGANQPDHYTILSTQTSSVDKNNKCEWFWDSSITIEAVTYYPRPGNPGSKLLANNIIDEIRVQTNDLVLDAASDLEIFVQTQDFPNGLAISTDHENIFREFITITFRIK